MPLAPYVIDVPQATLDDLAERLATTRLPPGEEGSGAARLVAHWRDGFDWAGAQARLNRFAQFHGEVDGAPLHLIHEKGKGEAPLPLILTHGFPDSVWRFEKLIPLLTDPAAHGGDCADAFDVVAPSLPGFAFSPARDKGGGIFGVGDLWRKLMVDELGYAKFGAHGGDWGSLVCEQLARSHAAVVVGVHLTDAPFWHALDPPDDLAPEEKAFIDGIDRFRREDGAYALMQGSRPQTLADALQDSPAGLAAWFVDMFARWSDCGGDVETRFSLDDLLTNLMLYWAPGAIASSFRPYHDVMNVGATRGLIEAARNWLGSAKTPAGFAIFPKDIAPAPRAFAERYFNVRRWTGMPRGGHFAAFEEPALLAEDIRAFFRPLRGGL